MYICCRTDCFRSNSKALIIFRNRIFRNYLFTVEKNRGTEIVLLIFAELI